jgi:hypothetical protein
MMIKAEIASEMIKSRSHTPKPDLPGRLGIPERPGAIPHSGVAIGAVEVAPDSEV